MAEVLFSLGLNEKGSSTFFLEAGSAAWPNFQSALDERFHLQHKKFEWPIQGYRERALKMYPLVCGRCAREFSRTNLRELPVHHRNHNHADNPPDRSNWALLCVHCHDNEHSRQADYTEVSALAAEDKLVAATSNPFGNLKSLLEKVSPKDG